MSDVIPDSELSTAGRVRRHVDQVEEIVSAITFPSSTSRADIRRHLDAILAALDDQSQADFNEAFQQSLGGVLGQKMGESYALKVTQQLAELEAIVRALATIEPLVTKGEVVHGEWEQCGICGAVNRWVGDNVKHDQSCVWWDAAAWVLDHPVVGEDQP